MKVAIIGCGLIGRKRALALDKIDELVACCDIDSTVAEKFSQEFSCKPYIDYRVLLKEADPDVVIVAVINKYIKNIVCETVKLEKHVMAEKPLGRNSDEAKEMYDVSLSVDTQKLHVYKTGFNYRFHPALFKAKQICDAEEIGNIFSIRARYGHGGRSGMEKEWRASKDLCGGGELLDQGVHIIDLIHWFGGEVKEVYGKVETKFWDMEVEDNAFALMGLKNGITASFHVSWTNWKNIFSFEVFGSRGYLRIEGLGGSYGEESLELGLRNPAGGRPEISTYTYGPEDISWQEEWKEFKSAILERREVIGSFKDGYKANEVVEKLYLSSQRNEVIFLD